MYRMHVDPKGQATPQADIVIKSTPSTWRAETLHPYYAWCGKHDGHMIDMIPIIEKGAGCMSESEVIEVYVDGIFAARIGVDGEASTLADYLRGGHYDGIGASLSEHEQASRGKTSLPMASGWNSVSSSLREAIERIIHQ